MPTNERAVKGEKNEKTTDDSIPGKEKSKNRIDTGFSPQAEKPHGENDRTDGSDENKKSNR